MKAVRELTYFHFSGDTKLSAFNYPSHNQLTSYILSIRPVYDVCYLKLIYFFCDLNFLYEYLISP